MRNQIKLNIVPSSTDRLITIVGYILCAVMIGIAIWQYPHLPEEIPKHFNMTGEVDGYGSKEFIFFMPILSSLLYLGINYISRFPHTFNYTVKITEENAMRQYTLGIRLLRNINVLCVLFFFCTNLIIIFGIDRISIYMGFATIILMISLVCVILIHFIESNKK